MINSACRTSIIREKQRRNSSSMQALPSLMEFQGKKINKFPSIPTNINAVSTWSGMVCGMYSPSNDLTQKIKSWAFFYISLNLPLNKWNYISISFIKFLRQISVCFRTWHRQECTWGLSNYILQRVRIMLLLIATGPE